MTSPDCYLSIVLIFIMCAILRKSEVLIVILIESYRITTIIMVTRLTTLNAINSFVI